MRSFAEKCIKGFKNAAFKNIELAGFFWGKNDTDIYKNQGEIYLVKEFSDFVRKNGLVSVFDFGYLSQGFDRVGELGISGAFMHPEVSKFENCEGFSYEMLSEFAQSLKNNNMGASIDIDGTEAFSDGDYLDAGRRYENHLYYGRKEGYINACNLYTQGKGPGTLFECCFADTTTPKGVYMRRLYNLTYQYIRGTYNNFPPKIQINDFDVVSGDQYVKIDIGIEDPDSYAGDINITFVKMPEHGQVAVAAGNKTLVYSADADYSGEDSFVITASDGFSVSAEKEVRVTVSKQEPVSRPEQEPDSHPEDSGEDDEEKEKNNSALYIASVFVVLIIIAAIVFVIVKARKKH